MYYTPYNMHCLLDNGTIILENIPNITGVFS